MVTKINRVAFILFFAFLLLGRVYGQTDIRALNFHVQNICFSTLTACYYFPDSSCVILGEVFSHKENESGTELKSGMQDIAIAKVNKDGTKDWYKRIGSPTVPNSPVGLLIDNAGNIIIFYIEGFAILDSRTIFMSLNKEGKILSQIDYNIRSTGISKGKDNSIYLYGESLPNSNILFNTIKKIDMNGKVIWSKSFSQTPVGVYGISALEEIDNGIIFFVEKTTIENKLNSRFVQIDMNGNIKREKSCLGDALFPKLLHTGDFYTLIRSDDRQYDDSLKRIEIFTTIKACKIGFTGKIIWQKVILKEAQISGIFSPLVEKDNAFSFIVQNRKHQSLFINISPDGKRIKRHIVVSSNEISPILYDGGNNKYLYCGLVKDKNNCKAIYVHFFNIKP